MADLRWHFVVDDPEAAARWYVEVLGARAGSRIMLPGGVILSMDLWFGGTLIAISGEFRDMGVISPRTLGGTYGALHLPVPDVDAVWARALAAGAREFEAVHDAFWGKRTGQFIDPFGHRWALEQHLRDVPHEEIVRLAAAAFADAAVASGPQR